MAIDLLFPRPVFETIDEEDVCQRTRLREACLQVIHQTDTWERDNEPLYRVQSSRKVNDQLQQSEPFEDLAGYIDRCSKIFLDALGFPGWSAEIAQMWTNVGKKGDFVFPHTHIGEGFISGDYFVSCDPQDGSTLHSDTDRQPPAELNPLNYPTFYYKGQEGRLLMYRAETPHSTFPQQGDERIVVSFNLTLQAPDK